MDTAMNLSKYIINKCTLDRKSINNITLQNLLYIIQKEFLRNGKLAFPDDFETSGFGPVIPNVFYRFSAFGVMEIDREFDIDLLSYTLEEMEVINILIKVKRDHMLWDWAEENQFEGGAYQISKSKGFRIIPQYLIREDNVLTNYKKIGEIIRDVV